MSVKGDTSDLKAAYGVRSPYGDSLNKEPWSNMGTYCCTTCFHFVPKEGSEVGRCRKHAPVVQYGYPAVYPHENCGDHKMGKNPLRR